mgnify:CR=1 FL=1
MIISSKPFINLRYLLKRKNNSVIFPWNNAVFFENGTHALIEALKLFNLPKGSKVAIPAYICNSIPVALRLHKFKPYFFDVPMDLKITSEYLERTFINDEISTFLLVDFFGFLSQENIETSKNLSKKGYKVIIDRCHSGISNRDHEKDLVNTDAIIFSLRKTFNSKDGGALLTNIPISKKITPTKGSNSIFFIFIRFIEVLVCKLGWPNIYSPFFDKHKNKYSRQDIEINKNQKISHYLYSQISSSININNISTLRIQNFNVLNLFFKNSSIKTLFASLDKSTIPQVLPVIDNTQSLKNYLKIRGIGAYSWPGNEIDNYVITNASIYPNTIELNRKIVCLPIHQSLKDVDISYVNEKLKNWNKQYDE